MHLFLGWAQNATWFFLGCHCYRPLAAPGMRSQPESRTGTPDPAPSTLIFHVQLVCLNWLSQILLGENSTGALPGCKWVETWHWQNLPYFLLRLPVVCPLSDGLRPTLLQILAAQLLSKFFLNSGVPFSSFSPCYHKYLRSYKTTQTDEMLFCNTRLEKKKKKKRESQDGLFSTTAFTCLERSLNSSCIYFHHFNSLNIFSQISLAAVGLERNIFFLLARDIKTADAVMAAVSW